MKKIVLLAAATMLISSFSSIAAESTENIVDTAYGKV